MNKRTFNIPENLSEKSIEEKCDWLFYTLFLNYANSGLLMQYINKKIPDAVQVP